MADTEDDARYPLNGYGRSQGYSSSQPQKLPGHSASYASPVGYAEDDDEDEEDEVNEDKHDDDDDHDVNFFTQVEKYEVEEVDDDDDDEEEEEEDGNDVEEDDSDLGRHQKKRKLKSLLLSYEFAPRVPAQSEEAGPAQKPSIGGRNSLADWSEHETFILLDTWGDRFLQHGRKSLRSEEWQEVAEKVSQESKRERTDTQCRNRLDTLKKKYKKEKMKLEEVVGFTSKWVYFKKMDMLLSASPKRAGLSHGVDSRDCGFMNPKVYQNRSNGLDETRDGPLNSESAGCKRDDSDGLPPKRSRNDAHRGNGSYFRLLADSILKFSEIYEKTENIKRQQMLELESMRMDFHRDLELQKRQIVERAQAEIAKIRQGYNEENDVFTENISGTRNKTNECIWNISPLMNVFGISAH